MYLGDGLMDFWLHCSIGRPSQPPPLVEGPLLLQERQGPLLQAVCCVVPFGHPCAPQCGPHASRFFW